MKWNAGHDNRPREQQRPLDEQGSLVVKHACHHRAGTNSGNTTVTKSSGQSASSRSTYSSRGAFSSSGYSGSNSADYVPRPQHTLVGDGRLTSLVCRLQLRLSTSRSWAFGREVAIVCGRTVGGIGALIRDAYELRVHDAHILSLTRARSWLSFRRPLPTTNQKRHTLEWILCLDLACHGCGCKEHDQKGTHVQSGSPTHQHRHLRDASEPRELKGLRCTPRRDVSVPPLVLEREGVAQLSRESRR